MRHLRLIVFGVTCFIVGVATGLLTAPSEPMATVELRNDSEKDIAELTFRHTYGALNIGALTRGQRRTVGLYTPGDSSYSLRVIFTDKQALEGGGAYLVAGANTRETITTSGIKSDYVSLYQR